VKRALVTGVTGQDGSYLAELLLAKGYEVTGVVRRVSGSSTGRLRHLLGDPRLRLLQGDLTDAGRLAALVRAAEPDEVYNLAAQSHVHVSFDLPLQTTDVTAVGALRLLDAVRQSGRPIRYYQASSSEQFGLAPAAPQDETTPFHPRSPYGCAKVFAHHATVNYRESYGLHASCGILFNHESPRRGEAFVTRKITRAAARIKLGLEPELRLGNLEARRDWGFAGDYVEAMWRMLQEDEPGDYVIATGESRSVRDFLAAAFACVDLDWERHVVLDPDLHRPAEVGDLRGDATKARERLGWRPRVGFAELVERMVEADLAEARREAGP